MDNKVGGNLVKKKCILKIFVVLSLMFFSSCCVIEDENANATWNINEKNLREKVLAESQEREIILNDYTDFEWDTLYEFGAYISKEKIYEIIGFEFYPIKETVSEGMNQILFLSNDEVVCYLYGYPSNNKYGFYIPVYDVYVKLLSKDNPQFNIKMYEYDDLNITKLEYMNEEMY